jgi:uncharacterized protein YjbJ (UPF0337 family)
MVRDQMEGKGKEAMGGVKEQAGKLTGDEQTETEGTVDQAEGKGQEAMGKAKDAAGDAADKAKDALKR